MDSPSTKELLVGESAESSDPGCPMDLVGRERVDKKAPRD